MSDLSKTSRLYPIVLHLLLASLALTTIFLVRQNQDLRQRLTPAPQTSAFEVGDRLAPIRVVNIEGSAEDLRIGDRDRSTLLFFFTTTCGACQENQGRWRTLHNELAGSLNIVGVRLGSNENSPAPGEVLDLPYRVVSAYDTNALVGNLRLDVVPETVLVDAEGQILGSWLGVLDEDTMAEIASMI